MAALDALLDDLLLAILQRLSTDDLLGVRFVSRRLRLRGAAAVRSLVALGGELPAAAWCAFPGASRLVLRLRARALHVEGLRGLLQALPARFESFCVVTGGVPVRLQSSISVALSDHLVPQLLASAAAAGLQEARFSSITSAAAEQLLRGLPSLKHAHL
jgi:hypothetical protein